MTITVDIREQVRQRANFACEFCGVSEINTGGQLTIDHFQLYLTAKSLYFDRRKK
jgi:hypothetical protein